MRCTRAPRPSTSTWSRPPTPRSPMAWAWHHPGRRHRPWRHQRRPSGRQRHHQPLHRRGRQSGLHRHDVGHQHHAHHGHPVPRFGLRHAWAPTRLLRCRSLSTVVSPGPPSPVPRSSVPAGSAGFIVRVPTTNDIISEPSENITLGAATPQNVAPVVGTAPSSTTMARPPCRSPAPPSSTRPPAPSLTPSRCPTPAVPPSPWAMAPAVARPPPAPTSPPQPARSRLLRAP